ncbi:MAG: DUF2752 domain-containing protein [Planctomycetes bacterium]|nr:DUF2752 domain-containing protein [Planctomycetota bacterium]
MAAKDTPPARAPWTIPLAAGPVAAWVDRLVAVLVAAVAITAVVALLWVQPNPQGYDTHVQFGMQPCGWPRSMGMPCPTCGCTTAAGHVVRGELLRAFAVQPFGALLAVAGLLLGLHAVLCLLRRRSFVDLFVRLPFYRFVVGAVALLLLAWGYKCWTFAP